MKKLYLLLGMIAVVFTAGIEAMQRPAAYRIIDALVEKDTIDWVAIFAFLDSMPFLDVNEYIDTYKGRSLLHIAVTKKNLLAAKTLLEKYKANPNAFEKPTGSFLALTPLMIACLYDDLPIVKLLLHYGANPNLKNKNNLDSFPYAEDKNPEILKELNKFKK